MKFYLNQFRANNLDMKIEDIITSFRAGIADTGIAHIRIETVDKYVRINTNASIMGGGLDGKLITIQPFIYDADMNDLYDTNFTEYLKHPDWYMLEFVVDFSDTPAMDFPTMVCTPLKYEYHIIAIPHDIAFNSDVLKEVELLDLDEEE